MFWIIKCSENAPKEPASFRNEMESKLAGYFSEKPFSSSEVCCGIMIAVVGVLVIDMRKPSCPPIRLLLEQGCVQVAVGAPFAVGAGGCCGLACG